MNPVVSEQPTFSAKYKQAVFHSLWISQMVSMMGSGVTAFALRVWAFEQTESVTQFALITFFYGLPGILLSPIAGVWADRWNRRWIMILSDIGAGIATFFIWLLFVMNTLEVWHIYTAVILISLFNTLQQPAYAATIPMLVPKENLGRANGITQIGPALARIMSPMLGGFLLVAIGLNGVAEIDLATFLFAMLVMVLIRFPRPAVDNDDSEEKETMRQKVTAGWQYVRERAGLLNILLLFMVIDFTQGMIVVLIAPLVLGFADASVLGTVFAVSGMGALFGAVAMGVWGGPKRRVHGVLGFSILRSLLLLMGGLQPNAW
ncbi:MAG: MFS transporter, partial [Chloroflexi bacterium]|nr:MFS transporter [Chloroflexota bacterium]